MKRALKRIIRKSVFLSDIIDKGVGTKVRLETLMGNALVNFLFRQNTSYSLWSN